MREPLEQRAAAAVELAKKLGAGGAIAWAERSRSVAFRVRNGKLEQVTDNTARALEIRMFVDGRYSAHSTTDLRPERLEAFVREAVAMTRALEKDPHRKLPDPALFAGRPDPATLDLVDASLSRLDRDRRLELAQRMSARVAGHEGLISATSEFSDDHTMFAGASSNGFSGSYEATMASLSTSCTLDDGDKRPEEWSGAWGRHAGPLPDPEQIADEALARTRARLGAKKGTARRATMVVEARAAGNLIKRLLGPASGGAVQQGRSFWRDKLGKKMVSPKLTITDNPLIERGDASRPFDSEGIAASRLALIERGVFANYLLNTYYASKLSMKPTTGGTSNVVVAPGKRPLAQVVSAAGKGVLVTSWLGGNMDSTTGDFSFGMRGHVIENGAIGAPIGEMNVTGNIVQLFSHLQEVGSDPWPYGAVRVPTLAFADVQFS